MCGVCSRRKADELIQKGDVTVNNKTIQNLATKVSNVDLVCVKGRKIFPESKKYILLNKPKGYITTMNDEKAKNTKGKANLFSLTFNPGATNFQN